MADFLPSNDMAALIAGSGKTNADFDFSKLNTSYWEGLDQAYKQRMRDAFKDGVPTGSDGQPDYGAMSKRMFQLGDVDKGTALSNLDILRQNRDAGVLLSDRLRRLEGGGGAPQPNPSSPDNTGPPSTNRTSTEQVAPDLTARPQQTANKGTNIGSILVAQGFPNNDMPRLIETVSANTGIGKDQMFDPLDPAIRPKLTAEIARLKKMQLGQAYGPGEATPAPQQTTMPPQPPAAAPASFASRFASNDPNQPIPAQPPPPQQLGVGVPGGQSRPPPPQLAPAPPPPQWPAAQPPPAQVAQAQPIVPTPVPTQSIRPPAPNPQVDQRTFGAPSDLPNRGALPTGNDPEVQRKIGEYTAALADPRIPADTKVALKAQLDALLKQTEPTNEGKNYEVYRRQGGNLSYQDWTIKTAADTEGAKKKAEGDYKEAREIIDRGTQAGSRLNTLNTLANIINADPNITMGFGAQTALKVQAALKQIGIDTGDLSGPQTIQKLNALLATEAAKAVSPRTTQFEFKTFLANNPGLDLTREGNLRVISIFSQMAKRDVDLGKLARQSQGNMNNWDSIVEAYDKRNPIRDPVTKNVLSSDSIIAPGPAKAAAAPEKAAAAPPAGSPDGTRRGDDGGWYFPDPARPGKFRRIIQ